MQRNQVIAAHMVGSFNQLFDEYSRMTFPVVESVRAMAFPSLPGNGQTRTTQGPALSVLL
jgi:hypothetical protein